MADTESGYKWWLRYILIPLIGGGGLVAMIVAIINRPPPGVKETREADKVTQGPVAQVPVTQGPATQGPVAQVPDPGDPKVQVEKLVARWVASWLEGRTDDFISVVSEPFYFDQKIILTKPELRSEYELLRQTKGESWKTLEIISIKVQTARDLQNSGHDLSKDRIFGSLNLTLDDYAVVVTTRQGQHAESMLVAVRRIGSRFEVAGVWD